MLLALRRVVHRVRRAVGVDRRDDEDVEVVDAARRLGIGAVVAHQALSGLEADAASVRHLAGVLLAVDEDADLLALRLALVVADAEHLTGLRAARVRSPGRFSRSLSGETSLGDDDAGAGAGAVLARASTSAEARRVAR